jgi:hypothetical protein
MSNTDLLNGIQSIIIDFANREGINLADEFATVQDFKQFVIALTFKQLTDMGIEVEKAFDMTLGDGQFQAMFDRLRAA